MNGFTTVQVNAPITSSFECQIGDLKYRAEFPHTLYQHVADGRFSLETSGGAPVLVINGETRVTMKVVEEEPFIFYDPSALDD